MKCINCGCDATVLDKGVAFNRCALLASETRTLREQVQEWEKTSRKTPPKTLVAEWVKVRQAKVLAEAGKKRLEEMWAEMVRLAPIADWWPDLLGPDPRTPKGE